jgi:uncharacterized protein (DUF486 family)
MRPELIFILLFIFPAILYTLASFYNIIKPAKNIYNAIIIAICFACIEYTLKIPIIKYGHDNKITPFFIQSVWIILTLILSYAVTLYIGHKNTEKTIF